MPINKDVWRVIEPMVKKLIDDAVAAHEAKTDITNAHTGAS